MILGIIPNISKQDIVAVVNRIAEGISKNSIDYYICDSLLSLKDSFPQELAASKFVDVQELVRLSNMVISIGGDGTMLNTAYTVKNFSTPIIGVNIGKLGFLAEFDLESFNDFLLDLKNNNYVVEERMTLVGRHNKAPEDELYAINDIVIDKGPWQKMIEITIKVDDDYVSTFSADGIIIATPTGSTGYSLSTGGPIVNPKADVITLSPVAPHSLTMRPLVVSSNQKITILVNSPHQIIHASCDGQRVFQFDSPAYIEIEKSSKPVRLVHSKRTSYFEILRNKLYWGLDVRKTGNSK